LNKWLLLKHSARKGFWKPNFVREKVGAGLEGNCSVRRVKAKANDETS
jgi:hypothetical protein